MKCTHNISTWAPWYAARSTQLCMLCDVCMHLLSFIHINNKQTTKINRRIWSDAHYGRVAAHALRRGVQNSHPHAPKHARTHVRCATSTRARYINIRSHVRSLRVNVHVWMCVRPFTPTLHTQKSRTDNKSDYVCNIYFYLR